MADETVGKAPAHRTAEGGGQRRETATAASPTFAKATVGKPPAPLPRNSGLGAKLAGETQRT